MATAYRDFAPTGFDARGLNLPDQQDWLVCPVSQNRDSGPLAESNFATMLRILADENLEYEIRRFGHWGCGWFEIILVEPSEKAEMVLDDTEISLMEYAVLDDTDLSLREWEAADMQWMHMGYKERIRHCKDAKESIFAARRDAPSKAVFAALRDQY